MGWESFCSGGRETYPWPVGLEDGKQMKVSLLRQWRLERNPVREGERRKSADDLAFIAGRLRKNTLEKRK